MVFKRRRPTSLKPPPPSRENNNNDTTATTTTTTNNNNNNNNNNTKQGVQPSLAEAESVDGVIDCCSLNMCKMMSTTQGKILGINHKRYPCHFGCKGYMHGYICSVQHRNTSTRMCCYTCHWKLCMSEFRPSFGVATLKIPPPQPPKDDNFILNM